MNLQRLIEQYISFQQSLGCDFITDAVSLRAFGRARGSRVSVASVRPKHVDAFLGKARPVTTTWFGKFARLRCFFQYAVSRGYLSTLPLPTVMPQRPPAFVPYIYSREEIRRLLREIDSFRRSICLEPVTIRTMILMFYGAGLRLREATNLARADADLSRSLLTIRNTKFGKTRLVPVGPQLSAALSQYDRTRPAGRSNDAPFFTTRSGAPVKPDTLEHNFRILCDRTGIRRTGGTGEQPRIHDFRHTFAVHRLTSWYQQGADVQRLLHHLSVYLGHGRLCHTQVYLSMTPELLREASQRFELMPGRRAAMSNTDLLSPWLRRFLLEYLVVERNLARNTQKSYRDAFQQFLPFVARSVRRRIDRLRVEDLSPARTRAFLKDVEETRGCGISTRNQRLAAIRSLARFIGLHSPEHLQWCGQIQTIALKKAARS